jgi:predicted nucleic acid-binding protein
MTKRALIDANVILRYLTKDPAKMAEAAFKIFDDAKNGKLSLLLTSLTVAEVVWVLESFYDHSKTEIAQTIAQLLFCDGLEVEDLDLLMEALTLYQGKNLDFADAFLAAVALRRGPQAIYSFDQHFNRVPGISRLEPGKD